MKKKSFTARMISGLLSAVMVLQAAVTPITAFASEMNPEEELKAYVEALPELDQVKDQLDPEEVVTAKDYEVDFDTEIDLKKDFTNLEIPDKDKVKVNFYEAKNADKADFSTGMAGTYKAVYYVEPTNELHPVYRISRNITVKEPVTEAQTSAEADGGGEDDASCGESEDADADPAPETAPETEEPHVVYEFTEEAYELEMAAAQETAQAMEKAGASSEQAAAGSDRRIYRGIFLSGCRSSISRTGSNGGRPCGSTGNRTGVGKRRCSCRIGNLIDRRRNGNSG